MLSRFVHGRVYVFIDAANLFYTQKRAAHGDANKN